MLGVGFVSIGLVEIYNWGVSPANRIAWAFLGIRILLLFGPLLLTIGAFLIFYRRPVGNQGDTGAGTTRVRGSKILLLIGGGLIAVPFGLLFMAISSHVEILGFLGAVAFVFLGLPGLVLIAIGAARLKCLRLLLTDSSAHLKALWRDL